MNDRKDEPETGFLARLKEVLLSQPPPRGGEDDTSAQAEQVLHFVRRVEEEDE